MLKCKFLGHQKRKASKPEELMLFSVV